MQSLLLELRNLVNKVLELHNSDLIAMYCRQDERFHQVALILKAWNRSLNKQKNSRLNSFSIYMHLLAFMLEKKMIVNLQRVVGQVPQILETIVYAGNVRIPTKASINFLMDEDVIEWHR